MLDNYPFIREVKSPISQDQLSPLDTRCEVVQFNSPLSEPDFLMLSDFLKTYPQVRLRIYGHYFHEIDDLSFLKHFSFIQKFSVDIWNLKSFDGLELVSGGIKSLSIGPTNHRTSLSFLSSFQSLRELNIDGHEKGIENIGKISGLEKLTLRSVTLESLEFLQSAQKLWWLALKLGGTRNLTSLKELRELKYLELWKINGLSNLEFIEDLTGLQFLFLQALRQVRYLPALHKLTLLRRLHLETMKGLSDLSPITKAPILEDLLVLDTPQLSVDDFLVLNNCVNLRRMLIGLGSLKKNRAVEELLPLERVTRDDFKFIF